MNLELTIILLVMVGIFAYFVGYLNGAKFTLKEFDRQFDKKINERSEQ